MSEWTKERAAAAFPVGSRVLVCGAEVGRMCFGDTTRYFCGTEAASLVAALENAPPRKG